jgi:hypothetical protein
MIALVRLAVALTTASLGVVSSVMAPADAGASAPQGRLVIIQAVPKESLDVTLDGHTVHRNASVGAVLGPLTVSAGQHQIGFTNQSGNLRLTSSVTVAPGSSGDVVVHLPAEVNGKPVINTYRTPLSPIAPGKARVLIAHTATVAPADVRVDGTVVFHDIANGEFATADLAAGTHVVALLPAGLSTNPILGPLHVDLAPSTVTMVYAVGNPRDHSMNVITHTAALSSNGAVEPATIDTGEAGLAARVRVHPFHVPPATTLVRHPPSVLPAIWAVPAAGALLTFLGLRVLPRRRGPGRPG